MEAFKRKIEALVRIVMVRGFSGVLPLYVVTEHPKSGGSWTSQMLSDYLDIPFPRNRFPNFQTSLMQGHYRHFPGM